jgi:hypothetical protein
VYRSSRIELAARVVAAELQRVDGVGRRRLGFQADVHAVVGMGDGRAGLRFHRPGAEPGLEPALAILHQRIGLLYCLGRVRVGMLAEGQAGAATGQQRQHRGAQQNFPRHCYHSIRLLHPS